MDYNNVLAVTVNHGKRSLYFRKKALTKSVADRILRGEAVYRDILATSTEVHSLVRDAKRWHCEAGGEAWWNKEYEDEARKVIAEEILCDACELVKNPNTKY